MKIPHLFLSPLSKEQKDFLNLLDLTAKVHGEERREIIDTKKAIWGADFFHLNSTSRWLKLSQEEQTVILQILGRKILQEAYFIEMAGMAYAGKMNLVAKTKEEREFFCFVAEEEARHLRMIEALIDFDTSLESIPSFALLIGEIIQEAGKPSHLLLIQILLEGWGLNYYKSLAKNSLDEKVTNVFKMILKDEIRHHSAGVLLFSTHTKQVGLSRDEIQEFISFLERIAFMVKVGPYNSCTELFKHNGATKKDIETFLVESGSVKITAEKMQLIFDLISKCLGQDVIDEITDLEILKAMDLTEMTDFLWQSIQ